MFKKIALAVACLTSAAAATPALATALTLTNGGGVHGSYSGVFTEAVSGGSFTDNYSFVLPSPLYNVTATVTSFGPILNGVADYVTLTSVLLGSSNNAATISNNTGSFGPISFGSSVGTYGSPLRLSWINPLSVSGSGVLGTSYQISINAVYAVPEPQTWVLMIGGLALAGLVVAGRRRGFLAA